jgi:hypothetical protein
VDTKHPLVHTTSGKIDVVNSLLQPSLKHNIRERINASMFADQNYNLQRLGRSKRREQGIPLGTTKDKS